MKTRLLKSYLSLAVGIASALMLAAMFASPALAVFLIAGGMLVSVSMEPGMALSALNITDLNTALGAYSRKNKDVLISEMLLGFNPEDCFEVWDDVKDEVPMPRLEISDLVKPANDTTFQPTANALNFDARIGKVRRWKVDLLLVPGALEKSWLGQYKKKGSDAYDMPFEEYIMNYIVKKVHENLRLQSMFKGVYNASGSTPIDVMDGVLKMVADEITGGLTPVATGVLAESTIVDQLLEVYDDLGEAYKLVPTQMIVAPQVFDWYIRKFNPLVNSSIVATDMATMAKSGFVTAVPLHGTNCILKREPGLGSSQRVICTPKENMVYLTDSLNEENDIKTQLFERTIKLMIDAKSGFQFKEVNDNALRVNDQA